MSPPNEILTPGTHLWVAGSPARPGALVVVHAQGYFRRARVVKNGPKRCTVEYATSGNPLRTKAVPHGWLYVTELDEAVIGSSEDTYAVIRQTRSGRQVRAGGHYLEGNEDLVTGAEVSDR